MENGYFIRPESCEGIVEELDCLESLLAELGASFVRRHSFIGTVYAVVDEEAVGKLEERGYFVEPSNELRALYRGASQPSQ
ncbi:hypothetical protein HY640_00945 [Candidatus Woesearchaeota archaeon]|nr:hypothetical protein [Candidatus Woesearchaeota archaeon]